MKQINTTQTLTKKALLLFASCLISAFSFSQNYSFQNPVLYSGTNGADGAVYKFSNVASGVDALVTINKRSSNLVSLDTVDMTGSGYGKAFQPMVTYNGGNASGPASWWMEFNIQFVKPGTLAPLVQDSVYITAVDVDGDGGTLQEQFTALGSATYTENSPSSLTRGMVTDTIGVAGSAGTIISGEKFTAPTFNAPGIDTTNQTVMVTAKYLNVSSITIRYGAQITSGSTGAANRMNCLWFQKFNYSAIFNLLPVFLESFTAQKNINSDGVSLNWVTTMEREASHFEVERSFDGQSYDEQGIVIADGNSGIKQNYHFDDKIGTASAGIIYYRLRMVDMNGKYLYSEVVTVRNENESEQLTVSTFPNPTTTDLQVSIPAGWQNKAVTYSVYSLNGSLVHIKTNGSAPQTETIHVAELPQGTYIVRVVAGSQSTARKFIKVR